MNRMKKTLLLGLAAPIAVLAWQLAPVDIGGRSEYAVIQGVSMEPKLERNDLVVIRGRDSYGVGDVVAFTSPSLGQTVLHRIVGVDGGRFVLRGDNNDFNDADRPTPAEIRGALALHIPNGGVPLQWAREPKHAALIGVLAALLVAGGGAAGAHRRGIRPPQVRSDALLVVCAVGVLLAAASFTRPSTRESTSEAYRHTGTFSYTAAAPGGSAVYGATRVQTGQPMYTALVRKANLRFRYQLRAPGRGSVSGTVAMTATLRGPDGWSRAFALAPARPFTGDSVGVHGTLDIAALTRLAREVGEVTGMPSAAFGLVVEPTVRIRGNAAGAAIVDNFAPTLAFQLTPTALQLQVDPATGRPSVPTTQSRAVTTSASESNALSLLGLKLPVEVARLLALMLLIVGGLGYLFASRREPESFDEDDADAVTRALGDRVVEVERLAPTVRIADVATSAALIRLADAYERVVLHVRHGDAHVFAVDEGDVSYRLRIGEDTSDDAIARLRLDAGIESLR